MSTFTFTEPIRDPGLFVGRHEIQAELRENLQSTVIIGEGRIGKTSLLLQLKNYFAGTTHGNIRCLPFYFNLRHPMFRSASDVFELIGNYINRAYPTYAERFSTFLPSSQYETILKMLALLQVEGEEAHPILLIDNIDHPMNFPQGRTLFYSSLRTILDFSPESLRVRLITSASTSFLTLEESIVSKLLSRLQPAHLSALSEEQTWTLASKSPVVANAKDTLIIRKFLFDQSGGHPCLLQEILVNSLKRERPGTKLLKAIEEECEDLQTRGGSFFGQYLSELDLREIFHLVAMALDAPVGNLNLSINILDKFRTAGLLAERGEEQEWHPSCRIFFGWLKKNMADLMPRLSESRIVLRDTQGIASFLESRLPAASRGVPLRSERQLQEIIQAMLSAINLNFIREHRIIHKGKKYRIDFVIPDCDLALEIKFINHKTRVGKIIDELEADASAYASHFGSFLALLYDTTKEAQLETFLRDSTSPYARYLLITP